MSTSMLLGLFDWIGDFFKSLFDLIPKIIYLLYASMACVLDVLQLFFRKLAGLDVYYVDGKAIGGDIVTNFITGILGINKDNLTYSALSTVFWSMIVFGIIICFACTIVAIIKSHYNYDEKAAKGPMQYVYTAGKAVINMVAVPIIVVLGLYVSEAILTALDTITSVNSGTVEAAFGDQAKNMLQKVSTTKEAVGLDNSGKGTYIRYDIFGFDCEIRYGNNEDLTWLTNDAKEHAKVGATSQPFSGALFKTAAYNGNRVRLGQINKDTIAFDGGDNLFANAKDEKDLADMVDLAFSCNLLLKNKYKLDYGGWGGFVSMRYFTNYLTRTVSSYSKFNVGLVWYYYDLWQFNFIVGFAGIIVCISIFINVILGLITRLFMCIVLFLVAPPLFGLAPLDGGKAGKGWRENFMKQALMAYGAVVGMNLVLMILPYMNEIDFFNIAIADYFAQTLVIIVGLITIKAVIATLSGLIGAADANETGGKIAEEVGSVAGKATKMTIGAAKLGVKGLKAAGSGVHAMDNGLRAAYHKIAQKSNEGKANALMGAASNTDTMHQQTAFNQLRAGNKKQAMQALINGGMSKQEARQTLSAMKSEIKGGATSFDQSRLTADLGARFDRHSDRATAHRAEASTQAGFLKKNVNHALKGEMREKGSGSAIGSGLRAAGSGLKLGFGKLTSTKGFRWLGTASSWTGRQLRRAGSGIATGAKAAWRYAGEGIKGLGSNIGEAMSNMWGGVKGDKLMGGFADASEINKKPDYAKNTAKSAAAQQAMQEWQLLHPGLTPTTEEMKVLREGKQPPERGTP